MTELWAKNACPYIGALTILDYNSALKWANFNIFARNLFYMIYRHKTHIIAKLIGDKIVYLSAKKPPKFN